jgi:hypothetical protein
MPVVFIAILLLQDPAKDSAFADVMIEKPYDKVLLAHPLFMDSEGARVFRLPDGTTFIVGVASTPVRDGSPKDRKRAEVVCKNRALASIVSERKGVVVAHVEKTEKKQEVVIDQDGKNKTKTVNEYLDVTRSKLEGAVPGFQIVGRWKSGDRKFYYFAVGGVVDARGDAVGSKGP